MVTVQVQIKGTRPILQHNGMLANPIDPLTRQVAALAKKKNKTVADYQALLTLEAYAGCWQTADGRLGLPTENVWSAIREAARMTKNGKEIERGLSFDPGEVATLIVGGKPCETRAYVEEPSGAHLFIRTVVVSRRRCLRARTIAREWSSTHTFTLMEDVLDLDRFTPIIECAGRLIGVGDWRPIYGRFDVTDVSVVAEAVAA